MKDYSVHSLPMGPDFSNGFDLARFENFTDEMIDKWFYSPHAHTYYEVVWFSEGGGVHTVDFVDYPIEDNTFFFLAPGQLHCFDGKPHKGMTIMFDADLFNDNGSTEEVLLKYSIFNAFYASPCVVASEPTMRVVRNLTQAMEKEMGRPECFGHRTFMQSLMRLMLITFQREYDPASRPLLNQTNNVHVHFLHFRRLLERDYRKVHDVQGYALEMGVSSKYLNKIVAQCTLRTPLQLINDRVMLEAKRLLRFSNKMVKEVAFELGFEDPSYFVKLFKRQTGMLPSEFREKVSMNGNW